MMFQRYVNDPQSNHHRQSRNRFERGAFAGHPLIGIIPFLSCPVHSSDVNLSTVSFAG
jgi:hypothetical protein